MQVLLLSQTLAKHDILSAPIVVSPGLEDVESLQPGESSPSMMVRTLLLKDDVLAQHGALQPTTQLG